MFVIGRGRYAREIYPGFSPPRAGGPQLFLQQATVPAGFQTEFLVETPPFATSIGKSVKMTLVATGETSVIGDIVSMTPALDGGPIGLSTEVSVDSGSTTRLFTLGMTWVVEGLIPGVAHTYGFRLTNLTPPNTIGFSATKGAYILLEELLAVAAPIIII